MKTLYKKKFFNPLMLCVMVVALYSRMPLQFFVQDEWHHFGLEYIYHSKPFLDFLRDNAFAAYGIRILPLTYIANYLQFSLFGTNPLGYSVISLVLHVVNTLLVYVFARKLVKNNNVAFIASALFGVWGAGTQAVTWLIQHTTTLPALSLSLLSLIFFVDYLEIKKSSKLIFSLTFAVLAFFFKETSYFILPTLLVLSFVDNPGTRKVFSKANILIIVVGLLYGLFLLSLTVVRPKSEVELFIPHTSNSAEFFQKRLLTVPFNTVSQVYVPQEYIEYASRFVGKYIYESTKSLDIKSPEFQILVEKEIAPKITYLLSAFLIVTFLLSVWKSSLSDRKTILVAGSIVLLSSFPLLFVLQPGGGFIFLESRYLYTPALGAVIIVALLVNKLITKNTRLGMLILLGVIVINSFVVYTRLDKSVKLGMVRRNLLHFIVQELPDLPTKSIIYVRSDSSNYGLSATDLIPPFQTGFGKVLLVSLHDKESFPLSFLDRHFLWDILSQDYKEEGGRAFGYYRDFELLYETVRDRNVDLNSVFAFRIDSKDNAIENISDEVRGSLRSRGSTRREIPIGTLELKSNLNKGSLHLMVDRKRDTFWNSGVQYMFPQEIDFKLSRDHPVSGVTIDSYTNADQNQVGYEVLTSKDEENWERVFLARRLFPDQEGKIDIYFKPTSVKVIKIKQIGYHQFATWQIHEISIYEAK